MRILIDIGHPGQVHFIKNMARNLQKKGHEILITISDKEMALDLLDAYGLPYKKVGAKGNLLYHLLESPIKILRLYRIARRFNPDILCGPGNPFFTLVGKMRGKPAIVFDDTELNPMVNIPTFFLATVVCTPSCFKKDLGKKQVRYNGYHELAYLHPNYFTPDPSVLSELGLSETDKYIVIRFVSWSAPHDIGRHGFDLQAKRKLIKELEKYAKVFISSESPLPDEFEKYRVTTAPEKIHDLLHYATMYVGEGGTMATEAAVLGTPSIYISSLVGTMGNFIELEQKYGLLFAFSNQNKGVEKATELIRKPGLKEEWKRRRQQLLKDKRDVTEFMVWFVENYPESFNKVTSIWDIEIAYNKVKRKA